MGDPRLDLAAPPTPSPAASLRRSLTCNRGDQRPPTLTFPRHLQLHCTPTPSTPARPLKHEPFIRPKTSDSSNSPDRLRLLHHPTCSPPLSDIPHLQKIRAIPHTCRKLQRLPTPAEDPSESLLHERSSANSPLQKPNTTTCGLLPSSHLRTPSSEPHLRVPSPSPTCEFRLRTTPTARALRSLHTPHLQKTRGTLPSANSSSNFPPKPSSKTCPRNLRTELRNLSPKPANRAPKSVSETANRTPLFLLRTPPLRRLPSSTTPPCTSAHPAFDSPYLQKPFLERHTCRNLPSGPLAAPFSPDLTCRAPSTCRPRPDHLQSSQLGPQLPACSAAPPAPHLRAPFPAPSTRRDPAPSALRVPDPAIREFPSKVCVPDF